MFSIELHINTVGDDDSWEAYLDQELLVNTIDSAYNAEFFQYLFHQSPDAMVLMDIATPEWCIAECNLAFCQMNGLTREQLIGQPINIVQESEGSTHTTDYIGREEYLQYLRSQKSLRLDATHRRPDGSEFLIETTNSLVMLEGREYLLGIDRDISDKMELDRLRRSADGFRALFVHCPDAMCLIDAATHTLVDCNEAYCKMNGYTREELIGVDHGIVHPPIELSQAMAGVDRPLLTDILSGTFTTFLEWQQKGVDDSVQRFCGESYHMRKDGTLFPIAYLSSSVTIDGVEFFLGIDRDITVQRRAQHLQRDTGLILELIAQGKPLAEVLTAVAAMIERQNPALFIAVMALQSGRAYCLAALRLDSELQGLLSKLSLDNTSSGRVLRTIADNRTFIIKDLTQSNELMQSGHSSALGSDHDEIAHRQGFKGCWLSPIATRSGGVEGFFSTYSLETGAPSERDTALLERAAHLASLAIEHTSITQQLEHRAHHDALTGLPNRVLFADRLERSLANARRRNDKVALMFLDLDGFKQINDTLGHHFGDELLQQVGQRLKDVVRDSDTVARMGGDEFTIILTNLSDMLDIDIIASKLLKAIEDPYEVRGHELFVTCSIGIALFPRDGDDSITLQSHADAAMYRAKAMGKNTYEYFQPSIGEALREREELKEQLRQALERNEFEILYQPQFCFKTGTIAGFEALLRWKHPELGVMLPASFIPVAEGTGIILKIGAWALEQACKQAKTWSDAGHEIKVGVNISALQFGRAEFAALVAQALNHSGLQPHLLELELAESVVMRNVEESARQLARLRKLGVLVSLDEFGKGYSGLTYLDELSFNALKINRCFIHHNSGSHYDPRPLLRAIIELGHSLGICVMAEGIESEEEKDILAELGCDIGQGFALGAPLTSTDASAFLQKSFETSIL